MEDNDIESICKESDVEDRFSDLPNALIDHILDFMPLRDAARTSILSRKWRYVWASHPAIILHPNAFVGGRIPEQNEFVNITTGILLQHLGPIPKFSLTFPSLDAPTSKFYPYVDHLLLFLSRNGIREITLDDHGNEKAYSLPPCVFSVAQLSNLRLTNYIFKSPINVQGLKGLAHLELVLVSFVLNKATSAVLNTPLLGSLILSSCSGVCHFKLSAPKLQTLYFCNNDVADLRGFLTSKHLQSASIVVDKPLLKRIDFTEICWQVISRLRIDGPTLMCLAKDCELQRLPSTCSSLKQMVVQRIKFADMHQVSLILGLLRSSPLLSKLEISVDCSVENATESITDYLSESHVAVGTMNNLQNVIIENFSGKRTELLFVKLLLSISPRLKTMAIQESASSSVIEVLSISKQLMRLSRASKKAVVVFEPDVKIPMYDVS